MAKTRTPKQVRKLDKMARENGFVLIRQGRHMVYRHPSIAEQLVISKSASDTRAHKNNLARLKRMLREIQQPLPS